MMRQQIVRWLMHGEPVPTGWREASEIPSHHSHYGRLIVKDGDNLDSDSGDATASDRGDDSRGAEGEGGGDDRDAARSGNGLPRGADEGIGKVAVTVCPDCCGPVFAQRLHWCDVYLKYGHPFEWPAS